VSGLKLRERPTRKSTQGKIMDLPKRVSTLMEPTKSSQDKIRTKFAVKSQTGRNKSLSFDKENIDASTYNAVVLPRYDKL
jgi:hypothetical protein